jgi:lysophospholipase L1-like esterase
MTSETRLAERLRSPEPITWLFAGDSITHGSVHLLEFRNYVQLFEERIRTELRRHFDVVVNTGVGGWRLADILAHREHVIFRFHPTIVSLAIGMNDAAHVPLAEIAEWEAAFSDLLKEILSSGCEALIIHTPPLVDTQSLRPMAQKRLNVPEFCEAIRRQATSHGAILVDHQAFWNERMAANERVVLFSQSDTIHPNTYGHRMMLECLCRELGIWNPNSPLGRLFQFL